MIDGPLPLQTVNSNGDEIIKNCGKILREGKLMKYLKDRSMNETITKSQNSKTEEYEIPSELPSGIPTTARRQDTIPRT